MNPIIGTIFTLTLWCAALLFAAYARHRRAKR